MVYVVCSHHNYSNEYQQDIFCLKKKNEREKKKVILSLIISKIINVFGLFLWGSLKSAFGKISAEKSVISKI